ncbi:MAG: 50S ribosomal protein L4 [Nanoarchaeota archaeon]
MNLVNLEGKKLKEINLPIQFSESYHPNLISRAFVTIMSNKRQPYGTKIHAGMRASAKISRRRRDYKGAYGHGISRVPRKILWHRGTQFGWVGAEAPGTVGGRRAHPPKASKIWDKKINIKERRKAIRSALSATLNKDLVILRNHQLPNLYPLIIENKFEDLSKTKDVIKVLENLGLQKELERLEIRKVRAGKGKNRGRKHRNKTGPLLVVSKECKLIDAAKNIHGINVVLINNINVELLAPGSKAGRLTVYTQGAIERLEKENIFM